MKRCTMELSLIELFSIKHALQSQIKAKKKRLDELIIHPEISKESREEVYKLIKDIEHEKELTDIFETTIKRVDPKIKINVYGG